MFFSESIYKPLIFDIKNSSFKMLWGFLSLFFILLIPVGIMSIYLLRLLTLH